MNENHLGTRLPEELLVSALLENLYGWSTLEGVMLWYPRKILEECCKTVISSRTFHLSVLKIII